jgi:hypothetical protein
MRDFEMSLKKQFLTAGAAMMLAAVLAMAQDRASLEPIHERAAGANTAAEHASVAREYRLQSEAFAEKARAHEKEAAQLTKAAGAMAYKWPAMTSRRLHEAKAAAVEARRAQREAKERADHHIRLAVEAQGESRGVGGN